MINIAYDESLIFHSDRIIIQRKSKYFRQRGSSYGHWWRTGKGT